MGGDGGVEWIMNDCKQHRRLSNSDSDMKCSQVMPVVLWRSVSGTRLCVNISLEMKCKLQSGPN